MLGVAIERDARHGSERCLFSLVARIGNNAESIGCEIAELQLAARINDVQSVKEQRIFIDNLLYSFGSQLA